jgi:uncharacterized protein YyaL (SSP411 family)
MKSLSESPIFINALIDSPSLYLRQHAHNPVMWHPWSADALQRARTENKPILLSIGYSSCYWCHVMEREVFENPSIAAYMNTHFVNIKVDREEHPEIDEIYMVARQLMTREGGWPNNVFLTPDLKPFFAGGTFGANDMHDRPAFPRLLEWLNQSWIEKRNEVEKTANETHILMRQFLNPAKRHDATSRSHTELVNKLIDDIINRHDDVAGGFYKQPKFPHETYLDFLITAGHVLDRKDALDTAAHSMLAMAAGGIYDQVGCGFHRYAIDRHWYVPHFEKMLHNQALCASIYTRLFALTNNPFFSDVARGTLEFVSGPMTTENGGFFTAIDAETDGVEGAYYAWTAEELQRILTEEEVAFFTHYFALADIPHFTGHKKVNGQVIIARKSLWNAAKENNLPYVEVAARAGQIMNKLLSARNQREAPLLDDKIITSWNGLMIAAFAEASTVFDNKKYLATAEKAADFIITNMQQVDGSLQRIYAGNKAYLPALLEDYSYLAHGLIDLHHAAPTKGWLAKAEALLAQAKTLFFDAETKGYRLAKAANTSPLDIQHASDSVLPSPTAMLLVCMVDLYEITQESKWLNEAEALAEALINTLNSAALPEYATLMKVVLKLDHLKNANGTASLDAQTKNVQPEPIVTLRAEFMDETPPASNTEIDLSIHVEVADGWYIAPHHAISGATKIEITGEHIAAILSIEYPTAEKFELAGKKISGYRGTQIITAKLKLKPFASSRAPIQITLHCQPCCEGQCLLETAVIYKV